MPHHIHNIQNIHAHTPCRSCHAHAATTTKAGTRTTAPATKATRTKASIDKVQPSTKVTVPGNATPARKGYKARTLVRGNGDNARNDPDGTGLHANLEDSDDDMPMVFHNEPHAQVYAP